ncbi:MAG: hypothetical protein ACKO7B_19755, partial [Flavobacteriales bacterium]
KPSAIALPLLLPVIDWHFGKWSTKRLAIAGLYVLPAAIFAYVTFVALSASTKIDAELLPDYSLLERLVVANFAFAYYIIRFVFPFGLSVLHLAPDDLPLYYYAAILFNVLLVYGLWRLRKNSSLLITGFLFYCFSIGLVVQLLPTGYNVVAERYTYFPYFGLSMMFGYLIQADKDGSIKLPTLIRGRMQALSYFLAAGFLVLSFLRAGEWKDLLTINVNIAERNPE